jgi:hypothetical protein
MKKTFLFGLLLILATGAHAQFGGGGNSGGFGGGSGGGGGSTSPGGGASAVQYNTGSAFGGDAQNLVWDSTHFRLGIGTGTPQLSLDVTSAGQAAVNINSLSGGADYIQFQANDRHTWNFGREVIGGDVGLEWNDTTTNIDQMKLSQIGDLTLEGLINASSATLNGVAYTFPQAHGSANQVLTDAGGNGALSWVSAGGSVAGSHTQIQLNQNGAFAASSKLTFSTATSGGYMTVSTGTVYSGATSLTVNNNGSGQSNLVLTAPTGVSAMEKIIRGSNDGGSSVLQFSDYPGSNVWQAGMGNGLNTFTLQYNAITPLSIDTSGRATFSSAGNIPMTITETTSGNEILLLQNTAGTSYVYEDVPAGAGSSYRFSEAGALKWYLYKDTGNPPNFDIANGVSGHVTLALNGSTDEVDTFGTTGLGTTSGTGTQIYRCSGGTDAGWVLYGNSGAAQTLCTGGGGSLVATGVWLP